MKNLLKAISTFSFLILVFVFNAYAEDSKKIGINREQTFNEIYHRGIWGFNDDGVGSSGSGSSFEATKSYRKFLEQFIKDKKIKSVVDAGAGDWEFSKHIDWGDADYLGVDIASDVVERVARKYSSKKVQFVVGDVAESLPAADLLICKDVLQHMSLEANKNFTVNNLRPGKYKWAIITNDILRDDSLNNRDIEDGRYTTIDLRKEPFNLKGIKELPIRFGNSKRKRAFLVEFK